MQAREVSCCRVLSAGHAVCWAGAPQNLLHSSSVMLLLAAVVFWCLDAQLPKRDAARAQALQHCNHVSRVGAFSVSLLLQLEAPLLPPVKISPPTLDSGFSPGYVGIIGSHGSWGRGTVAHWNLSGFAVPEHLGLCLKG